MNRHARGQAYRTGGLVLVVAILAAAGASTATVLGARARLNASPTPRPTGSAAGPSPSRTPTTPPDALLTLIAGGDVLPHLPVVADARTADGSYDFTGEFAPMHPWIAGADLALCHMEVPVAPGGKPPSGYPRFAAPAQLVTSLKADGWDGCSTASNHSVDQGVDGVVATLGAFDAAGLGHAGTARDEEEAASTQLYRFERGGQKVTVAHLAAAYGTNGLPVPAGARWSVNIIDADAIIARARVARNAGADVVVASLHCCTEYVTPPTERQTQVAKALATSGQIDLVIGHHAHVPQPIDRLPGGPDGTGMWVAYGLGNYISNQDRDCCVEETDSGLLAMATIRKRAGGRTTVENLTWTAVTVDRPDGHLVVPLSQLVASGAGYGSLSAPDLAARLARVTAAAGGSAAQTVTPPTPSGPGPTMERIPTG